MKLALIPPTTFMTDSLLSGYQMVLPQQINVDWAPTLKAGRKQGNYLILDNGIAEGDQVGLEQLVNFAYSFMVHEIILPDVIGDPSATITRAKQAEAYLLKRECLGNFNFMGVIQGTKWDDIRYCIEGYSRMLWVRVLGIPRALMTLLGENEIRPHIARYIQEQYPGQFKIHLLGTNGNYIQELARNGKDFNSLQVRGVDTSAPYNYAHAGKFIDHFGKVVRPAYYFTQDEKNFSKPALRHNIEVVQQWVQ